MELAFYCPFTAFSDFNGFNRDGIYPCMADGFYSRVSFCYESFSYAALVPFRSSFHFRKRLPLVTSSHDFRSFNLWRSWVKNCFLFSIFTLRRKLSLLNSLLIFYFHIFF